MPLPLHSEAGWPGLSCCTSCKPAALCSVRARSCIEPAAKSPGTEYGLYLADVFLGFAPPVLRLPSAHSSLPWSHERHRGQLRQPGAGAEPRTVADSSEGLISDQQSGIPAATCCRNLRSYAIHPFPPVGPG